MISFYPGPSQVEKNIPKYIQDAYSAGILSINHRSPEFMELAEQVVYELKMKLDIPEEYSVFFVSSATECWEIIAQSLVSRASYHIYNGAFGQKWLSYSKKINPSCEGHRYDINEKLSVDRIVIPESADTLCLTQNETSNGTQGA